MIAYLILFLLTSTVLGFFGCCGWIKTFPSQAMTTSALLCPRPVLWGWGSEGKHLLAAGWLCSVCNHCQRSAQVSCTVIYMQHLYNFHSQQRSSFWLQRASKPLTIRRFLLAFTVSSVGKCCSCSFVVLGVLTSFLFSEKAPFYIPSNKLLGQRSNCQIVTN